MDYKEKYNKLVKAVKVLQELRESEDERVREDILAFVKREGQHIDKYKWHNWIAWLEKQGQVKESEISQPIKETSKENDNSLTIQNGIILDGVVYELTENFPDNKFFLCRNCELHEKCKELTDETLCDFFGADESRNVFRKVMERKL